MKKPILLAATAAMLMTASAASAEPHHGRHYDRDYDRDRGHAYGHDRWEGRNHHWRRGERFDHYRSHTYIVHDYRRYGWRPPPRGYAYYRTDSGDIVLAAIATGIIASIIASH